ncbi:MAG: hypothetical protein C5B50_05580 [Verrucomicrobia bacterium]|nr:MAG: hypothetical protein C5B50_05580 [Verrucomicrobiota bacterium]
MGPGIVKHKRELIVRRRTHKGIMRILAEERPLLEYKICCHHCQGVIRQSILTNLFAGDMFDAAPNFSEHLCPKCGGDFTADDQQAALEHLNKLQLTQPQFSVRLLDFFHPERLS